jgi:hypothetical protein
MNAPVITNSADALTHYKTMASPNMVSGAFAFADEGFPFIYLFV